MAVLWRHHPTLLWFGVLGVIACTQPSMRPSPEPRVPEVPRGRDELPRAGPWHFAHAEGTHRYELRTRSIVEEIGAVAADTLAMSVFFTYEVQRRDSVLVIDGSVDSFTVTGTGRPAAAAPPVLPISFVLTMDSLGRSRGLTSPDTTSCGSPTGTMLTLARDLFVAVPGELASGMRWDDTTSATSCRGDVPVTVTTAQAYRVDGVTRDSGRSVLQLTRESTIRIAGTGTRRVQSTRVAGSGQGRSQLLLDPVTGRYLGSRGVSTLELTFDAASRRATFRQHTEHTVRRLAGPESE